MNPTTFPLCWPPDQAVTPLWQVAEWQGKPLPTFGTAYAEVEDELRKMGATVVAISSDVPTGKKGEPLASQEYRAVQKGAAAWFKRNGRLLVIACDRFEKPSQNLRAIAKILDGRRREERYGTQAMTEASWAAFQADALPQRATAIAPIRRPWHEVLRVRPDSPFEVVEAAYRALVQTAHPDKGGSDHAMAELADAITEAREKLR